MLKNNDQSLETEKTLDIEDAKVITPADKMDEILKNNDKFETIKVLMEILCKELGISKESQLPEIGRALNDVADKYYKSMEDFKKLTKKSLNNDFRQ